MLNRSQLNEQLKNLLKDLKKLEAKDFSVPASKAKEESGLQFYLKKSKNNFIAICELYEKIADTKWELAELSTDDAEAKSLLLEAHHYYSEAISDLEIIRVTPSEKLWNKLANLEELIRSPAPFLFFSRTFAIPGATHAPVYNPFLQPQQKPFGSY